MTFVSQISYILWPFDCLTFLLLLLSNHPVRHLPTIERNQSRQKWKVTRARSSFVVVIQYMIEEAFELLRIRQCDGPPRQQHELVVTKRKHESREGTTARQFAAADGL
jgi:hypothetical protein